MKEQKSFDQIVVRALDKVIENEYSRTRNMDAYKEDIYTLFYMTAFPVTKKWDFYSVIDIETKDFTEKFYNEAKWCIEYVVNSYSLNKRRSKEYVTEFNNILNDFINEKTNYLNSNICIFNKDFIGIQITIHTFTNNALTIHFTKNDCTDFLIIRKGKETDLLQTIINYNPADNYTALYETLVKYSKVFSIMNQREIK